MHILQFEEIIDSNKIIINGLEKYNGKKVQIIVDLKEESQNIQDINQKKAFEIINDYCGQIKPWTREELYDR
ncbi:MAG TPA: hypothetical protein DHW82_12205 [Spirochaetia bacterium]|nr:MAG: hypothetical protein A2Y41_03945 [Spirochaetes bacterium GWB1_36_13]HCL57753.1 hypothetical protein [Spirochaetia bacterium]